MMFGPNRYVYAFVAFHLVNFQEGITVDNRFLLLIDRFGVHPLKIIRLFAT